MDYDEYGEPYDADDFGDDLSYVSSDYYDEFSKPEYETADVPDVVLGQEVYA